MDRWELTQQRVVFLAFAMKPKLAVFCPVLECHLVIKAFVPID